MKIDPIKLNGVIERYYEMFARQISEEPTVLSDKEKAFVMALSFGIAKALEERDNG